MGTLLVVASLILLALILWAAWARGRARQAVRNAGLPEGRVIAVDAADERQELADMRQVTLYSAQYGVSGRPDRVIRNSRGPIPVDVKKCVCPRNGRPYDGHVAQVATYCLLLEEQFQCKVYEGVIDYTDRSISVPFSDQLRFWILGIIQQVRETKLSAVPIRSHSHRGKCASCGFRQECQEALR